MTSLASGYTLMTSSSENVGSSTSFGTGERGAAAAPGAGESSAAGGGPSTELSSRLCNRVTVRREY